MIKYVGFGVILLLFIFSVMGGNKKVMAVVADTPVVLELFTSQSCSSCPPADKILGELENSENIIALGCHVTYWDHLSWKDTLSHQFCTERQNAYATASGSKRIFTPEMRINGIDSIVGSRKNSILQSINRQNGAVTRVQINKKGMDMVVISLPQIDEKGAVSVNLLSFGGGHTQSIRNGENRGRTIDYTNPVNAIKVIASDWSGQAEEILFSLADLPENSEGFAVIVQKNTYAGAGKILAAGQYRK